MKVMKTIVTVAGVAAIAMGLSAVSLASADVKVPKEIQQAVDGSCLRRVVA